MVLWTTCAVRRRVVCVRPTPSGILPHPSSGIRRTGFVFSYPVAINYQRGARRALGAAVCGRAVLGAAGLLACGDRAPAPHATTGATATGATVTAITLTDDGGRSVRLARPARRVISLIPSATETLVALGATDRIIGRTRYDVAPEVATRPSVGGGLDPSIEAIVALHPDLVIGWENDKRQQVREKLATLGIPVFSLRTEDTTDVFRNVATLGQMTGRDSAAVALSATIRREFDDVRRSVAGQPRPRVFYIVFNDPPMTAGPRTFIAQLIGVAGAESIFPDVTQLWPTVAMEEIVRRAPDVVVVPRDTSRGDALTDLRARGGWRAVGAVRAGHVVTVSANLVNRPGPHIGEAARALRDAFHPGLAGTHQKE